ncbi:MAG TPA: PhnD/SsuA/transferrin family substrate-binding protein [Anaerolineae bacterium]|nr:PhnD/SsuA/transferrin family substrate-binding protein [Anaerolineae bacterium]
MRRWIYLYLPVILSACSVLSQVPPTATPVLPIAQAALPNTATRELTPTLGPTIVPTRVTAAMATAASFTPVLSPASTAISAARSTTSSPVCTKIPIAATPAAGELGSRQKPIVIALEVYEDAERTTVAAAQLADCLSRITGLSYTALVRPSASTVLEALGTGQAQVAFLDPLAILYGQAKYGLDTGLVILRSYQDQLAPFSQREFIARTASGVRSLTDLRGKTFCFGAPNSLSGTSFPWIVLAANGINPKQDLKAIKYVGFAEQIATAIYRGECDAGSTYVDVLTFPGAGLAKTFPDIHDQVQVFYLTDQLPNDGVQYVRTLDSKIKQATSEALLAMAADNPGKQPPLAYLYKIEGFMKANNQFYQEFAALIEKAGIHPADLIQ